MRVLVTGQSGLSKLSFLSDVKQLCDEKNSEKIDPEVLLDKKALNLAKIDAVIDLEQELTDLLKVQNYLDMNESVFINAKSKLLREISERYPVGKNVILATHVTYFRKKSFYHRLAWDSMRSFAPDMIITLIDDVHDVYKTITDRKKRDDYVQSVTLKDIMVWRQAEIMFSRALADNLGPKPISWFLVAKKMKPQIVYQLMFESHKKKVYASYPITATKLNPQLGNEAAEFLRELKKHFIVFNPISITEKKLHNRVLEQLGGPTPAPNGLISVDGGEYRLEDILPILTDITGQIITRDEMLIGRADAIICYRPAESPGAQYELSYAEGLGLDEIAYDESGRAESPFSMKAGRHFTNFSAFLEAIREYAR